MTRIHCCMNVEGALRAEARSRRRLNRSGFTRDDGSDATREEAIEYLKACRNEGKRVIPLGGPCVGFDFTSGCPGHDDTARDGAADDDDHRIGGA